MIVITYDDGSTDLQVAFESMTANVWTRQRSSGDWGDWILSIPQFYKNYNSLAELKAALAAI